MAEKRKKALIGMSGGVDSTVAAYLMQQADYDCTGATMQLFCPSEAAFGGSCGTNTGIADAKAVAERLGIPHVVLHCETAFAETVIADFVRTYEQGGTPNPCIVCNFYLKFGEMAKAAEQLGCDTIVTGHYANVSYCAETGRYLLQKAADETKDQSYFLYRLTQEQLAQIQFPLGAYHKNEVRELAAKQGFVNANRKESQDICFIPGGDYVAFLEQYTGRKYPKGAFVDLQGNRLGTHQGMIRYTIGQRKGLGLALQTPHYVCEKRAEKNEIVLGENQDLMRQTLTAHRLNWIARAGLPEPVRLQAKIRYRHAAAWAMVQQTESDTLQVTFEEPQRAITPGQAVVLYDGDTVVGGGIIA